MEMISSLSFAADGMVQVCCFGTAEQPGNALPQPKRCHKRCSHTDVAWGVEDHPADQIPKHGDGNNNTATITRTALFLFTLHCREPAS